MPLMNVSSGILFLAISIWWNAAIVESSLRESFARMAADKETNGQFADFAVDLQAISVKRGQHRSGGASPPELASGVAEGGVAGANAQADTSQVSDLLKLLLPIIASSAATAPADGDAPPPPPPEFGG